MQLDNERVINFIKGLYGTDDFLPLHEPVFLGNEKKYLNECIDSTFVSSVGKYVEQFEKLVADYVGSKFAVATVNGTAALHIALQLSGVDENTEVITQALSFVATCNAISYCRATPVFVDVDKDTMGLSPDSLRLFLETQTEKRNGVCFNKRTGKRISAVVPMHSFGHPCRIDEIAELCSEFNIPLIEDAAESLGSYFKENHTGTFGLFGAFSFNGNKTITTGGGGMIVTDDENLAKKAKHITTTAKIPHAYEFIHDEVAYNYRLPNINAALGCAQMETLTAILENKRAIAGKYKEFFSTHDYMFVDEPKYAVSNFWLNAIVLADKKQRDTFLEDTNSNGVMTRPIWMLMNRLEMFKSCQRDQLENSTWIEERLVNIPSGVRL